jgi:hypothetical protein
VLTSNKMNRLRVTIRGMLYETSFMQQAAVSSYPKSRVPMALRKLDPSHGDITRTRCLFTPTYSTRVTI